ncbi:YhcN/YlaJ family sporulation lipoprotein [Pueribacillus theae]|nr:YhcN/YlaJ family sporulation lipoprotein [Pueribacillus theae]
MVNVFRFCLTTMILSIVLIGCAGQNDNQQGMDNLPNNVNYNDDNGNGVGNDRNQNNGNNGNDDGNIGDNNGGRSRMEIADEAAERVTQLKEVRQANVLTTDNNAYVAALLEDGQKNELSEDTKNKIAQSVKAVDPDIDNVNVSTNPDFVDRVQEYADAVERGEPIEGLFDQLNESIERIFPTQE